MIISILLILNINMRNPINNIAVKINPKKGKKKIQRPQNKITTKTLIKSCFKINSAFLSNSPFFKERRISTPPKIRKPKQIKRGKNDDPGTPILLGGKEFDSLKK